MMTNEGFTKIVNFLTPSVLVLGHDHIVKIHFSSPLLVYTGTWIRQIKYIHVVMMTKDESTNL